MKEVKKKSNVRKRGTTFLRKVLQQTSLDTFFKPKPKTYDPGIPKILTRCDMPMEDDSQEVEQGSPAGNGTDMLCGDEVTVNEHETAGEK